MRLLSGIPFDLLTVCSVREEGGPHFPAKAAALPGQTTLLMSAGSSGEFWKAGWTSQSSVLEHLVPAPCTAETHRASSTDSEPCGSPRKLWGSGHRLSRPSAPSSPASLCLGPGVVVVGGRNQFSFYLDWRLSGQPRKKTLIYDQKEVGCEDSGRQGWVGAKR